VFDCALGAAARAIPDPRWRGEVVEVARRAGADQGVVGRTREVVATAAFGLRLRSLQATGGRAGEAWRQGARLGAGLLLVTAWVGSMAAVGDSPAGAGVATAVTALALGAALAAWVAGHRVAVVSATAVGLAAAWTAMGWDPVSTAVAIALGGMMIAGSGRSWAGTRTVRRWWRWPGAVGLGLLGLVALTGVGDAVAAVTAVAATLIIPAVLALGGADARYAVAAAVAWGWRFLALEPGDLVDAGSALLHGEGIRIALVRLIFMAWAFGLAVGLALRTERRAAL
jgi:hypothetical protein